MGGENCRSARILKGGLRFSQPSMISKTVSAPGRKKLSAHWSAAQAISATTDFMVLQRRSFLFKLPREKFQIDFGRGVIEYQIMIHALFHGVETLSVSRQMVQAGRDSPKNPQQPINHNTNSIFFLGPLVPVKVYSALVNFRPARRRFSSGPRSQGRGASAG